MQRFQLPLRIFDRADRQISRSSMSQSLCARLTAPFVLLVIADSVLLIRRGNVNNTSRRGLLQPAKRHVMSRQRSRQGQEREEPPAPCSEPAAPQRRHRSTSLSPVVGPRVLARTPRLAPPSFSASGAQEPRAGGAQPSRTYVVISPLPLTATPVRRSRTKRRSSRRYVRSVTWIVPGAAWDSILLAVLTVSPQMS